MKKILIILIAIIGFTISVNAQDCSRCSGKGEMICKLCDNGYKSTTCSSCNGNRTITVEEPCPNSMCGNSMNCGTCNKYKKSGSGFGRGVIKKQVTCSGCSGEGTHKETCKNCSGSITMTCNKCGGSGKE